jgi:hypothetical protein
MMQSSDPETSDRVAEMIFDLERIRTEALVQRDPPTIERLHAPEYELITPSGRVYDRRAYIDAIASEPFYASWKHGPMRVRLSSTMALLRYQALIKLASGRVVACRHIDAYQLRFGSWQAVWSQATELPLQKSIFAEPSEA